MKRVVMFLLVLCMVFGLCACGNAEEIASVEEKHQSETQPAESAPAVTELPQETEPEQEAETAPEEAAVPTYTVKLTDDSGKPMAGVMVQICLDSCMPGLTGEDGVAAFYVAAEAGYYATVTAMPEGYDYATEEQKFYFEDGNEVTIVLKAVA